MIIAISYCYCQAGGVGGGAAPPQLRKLFLFVFKHIELLVSTLYMFLAGELGGGADECGFH